MKATLLRMATGIGIMAAFLTLPTAAYAGGGGGGCYGGKGGVTITPSSGAVTPAAASVFSVRFDGLNAEAAYSQLVGTIQTDVFLDASDSAYRQTGYGASSSTNAFISISRCDTATGTQLSSAYGFAVLPESALTMTPGLQAATLTATIPVTDYISGSSSSVAVSLAWSGTGDISHSMGSFVYRSGDFMAKKYFNATDRAATVTGTISDGAANYAAMPSTFGDLNFDRSGFLSVIHP